MRKQILLIIILCLSAMMVRAERIDGSQGGGERG